ncbi:MAG: ABC transporter substrate-binding protein [Mariprofundaceae bacterium]|nr:ABC transporter substrate-binding protein [Mariprofundaceae bacterium]
MKLLCVLLSFFLTSSFAYAGHGKISLQLKWKHQFQFAGYYMALENGYYRDASLDVNIIEGDSEKQPIQQVLNHHSTYAITDTGALLARANGKPIKALAAIFQHSPSALMVLKSSGINTLKALIKFKWVSKIY